MSFLKLPGRFRKLRPAFLKTPKNSPLPHQTRCRPPWGRPRGAKVVDQRRVDDVLARLPRVVRHVVAVPRDAVLDPRSARPLADDLGRFPQNAILVLLAPALDLGTNAGIAGDADFCGNTNFACALKGMCAVAGPRWRGPDNAICGAVRSQRPGWCKCSRANPLWVQLHFAQPPRVLAEGGAQCGAEGVGVCGRRATCAEQARLALGLDQ